MSTFRSTTSSRAIPPTFYKHQNQSQLKSPCLEDRKILYTLTLELPRARLGSRRSTRCGQSLQTSSCFIPRRRKGEKGGRRDREKVGRRGEKEGRREGERREGGKERGREGEKKGRRQRGRRGVDKEGGREVEKEGRREKGKKTRREGEEQ